MKKLPPISTSSDWTFETIDQYYNVLNDIATNEYGLDCFTNQIEIISSEQMLDAYASIGVPIFYNHWSFGQEFIKQQNFYKKGYMGLAYEIVINSNPCIAYLMEENTMLMQILVMAHACFGHNAFFKGNYLFKQWTDPEAIVDYLSFAKKYIAQCEERYGYDEVEFLLDACHALQLYGVDKYKRPPRLSVKEEEAREKERQEYLQSQLNEIWSTIPTDHKERGIVKEDERFPQSPQENILYFIEKNAPNMEPWKREIVRIIRKIAQYFYPQMQTKAMNEGFACVTGDTLIDTPNGLIRADELVKTRYSGLVYDGDTNQPVTQWYDEHIKPRIRIQLKNGFEICGGADHRININDEWIKLENLNVGDNIPIIRGDNTWPQKYVLSPRHTVATRPTIEEACKLVGVHIKTYYKWKNESAFVSEQKATQCEKVQSLINTSSPTSRIEATRRSITLPSELNEDFAYWLGLLIGDGGIHVGKYSCIYFVSGDPELRDWFLNYSQSFFSEPCVNVIPDRDHWVVKINSKNLVDYLITHFGFKAGKTSDIKIVPPQIFKSPQSVVAAFIRGHMDTDGCAAKKRQVILISKSKELISVEQQLLLKMSIVSSIKQQKDDCYRLTITGSDTARFYKLIGFGLKRKQDTLEQDLLNCKRYLPKKDMSEIVSITKDIGPVFDFGVENSHKYKASAFINHNCFWHYQLLNDLYDRGYINDGYMQEFLITHTNVITQPSRGGINPYALGFAIFQDIKRISINPTEEDRRYFDFAGNGDWVNNIIYAMKNFKDESFILQYLSPKVIRDFHMYSILDNEKDPKLLVTGIHDDLSYKHIKKVLAAQYNIGYHIPDLQIEAVDRWGDRSTKIRHNMVDRRPLDNEETIAVLKHYAYLWGYDVYLDSYDENDQIRASYSIKDGEALLDVFLDDEDN